MRKCVECGSTNLKRSEFDLDYSAECGIAEIVISSALRHECADCSFVTIDAGKLKDIDEKLVKLICSQSSLLTGNQSRFLRLRHFKMDLYEFAKLTEIDAMTLELTEADNMEHRPENSLKIRSIMASSLVSKEFVIQIGDEVTTLKK